MTEYAAATFFLNLLASVAAIGVLLAALRVFDWLLGVRFKDVWQEICDENNAAVAQYLGLRFVGCCIVVGCVFS